MEDSGGIAVRFGGRPFEFLKIGEVLGAACSFFGGHQVRLAEVGNEASFLFRTLSVLPAGGELKPRDRGQQVDLTWWDADTELSAGFGKVRLIQSYEWKAKALKGSHELSSVLLRRLNPEIKILGVARLRVVDDRITTDDEKPNLLVYEDS